MRAAFTDAPHMHLYVIYPVLIGFAALFLGSGVLSCATSGAGCCLRVLAALTDPDDVGAALGRLYESLLELEPRWDATTRAYQLTTAPGNARKTSGTYYTPAALIDCLLDTALDPVIRSAESRQDPEIALLALRVCDPSCGSGQFLVAAARRIAASLAAVRAGPSAPSDDDINAARRDVVRHCVYGVDLDPVAVDLTTFALWVQAGAPRDVDGFLHSRIRVGDALLGTTTVVLTDDGTPAADRALLADTWCAERLSPLPGRDTAKARQAAVAHRAQEHHFFHWDIEFPEVFADGRPGFDAVVGNPPFLNQLESATASGRGVNALHRALAQGTLRPYTDISAAFLYRAAQLTSPGGYVGLVQPQSLLAARDAGADPRRARLIRGPGRDLGVRRPGVRRLGA
jgi:hypothetical protein